MYNLGDCHLVAKNVTAQEGRNFHADLNTYIWKKNEGSYTMYTVKKEAKTALALMQI